MAAKLGFWGVELDAICSKDGAWVIMHDLTADRTTDGTGNIYDMTFEQIKSLNIDGGNNISLYNGLKVPTLEEVLKCCELHGLVPVIHINGLYNSNYDTFVELIKKYGFEENCICISYGTSTSEEIRRRSKKIKLQILINNEITQTDIDNALKLKNCGIDTGAPTEAGVILAHKNNIEVGCYTINDFDAAKNIKDMGCDYYTSDFIMEVF